MADGGVTEAALLAAAAESSAAAAAAGGTAAAAAATLPEVVGTGAALAGTAAATAPEIAAAALPEVAAATAPEALPIAATAATDAPLTFATSSEPLLGAAVAPDAAAAPSTSLLGPAVDTGATSAATPATTGVADTGGSLHSAAWQAGTGPFAPTTSAPSSGLLSNVGHDIGQWWNTTSTGTKLEQAGKLLSGVGTAGSAAKAATPAASPGPSHTMTPGSVGKPQGGEQQLAAIVDAMLRRHDAYQQGQLSGAPIAYRPRGLLG